MALKQLHLLIQWPSDRKVSVDVIVLPEFDAGSAGFRFFKIGGEVASEEIGPEDLDSLPAFHKFLARLTRSAAAGEERRVSCDKAREERLLELLKIEGPPPNPIPITLPSDG